MSDMREKVDVVVNVRKLEKAQGKWQGGKDDDFEHTAIDNLVSYITTLEREKEGLFHTLAEKDRMISELEKKVSELEGLGYLSAKINEKLDEAAKVAEDEYDLARREGYGIAYTDACCEIKDKIRALKTN